MKRKIILLACLWSVSAFAGDTFLACPQALPTDNPNFCPSFRTSATCHCTAKGMPKSLCQDLDKMYDRMVGMFGSLQKACAFQKDTPTQTCIDDWNCYRLGGKDSQGKLCSSTGNRC